MTEICNLLKLTRTQQGLSLEDVAQRTYIKLHYLQALEEGRFDLLPAAVYTYGYIRQYAKILGLDGSALVAQMQHRESRGDVGELFEQRSVSHMTDPNPYPRGRGPRNGHSNGQANGHPSGQANGHSNGHSNGRSAWEPQDLVMEADDTRYARSQAQQILQTAEHDAQQMLRGAERYADDVLAQLEIEVTRALQIISNGRLFLQSKRQSGYNGAAY